MILYVLQIGYLTETISELTELFGVSYSTANRAVRWLQSKGFIFTGRANKNIQFLFLVYELWDKALPHLISPIEKIIKTNYKWNKDLWNCKNNRQLQKKTICKR